MKASLIRKTYLLHLIFTFFIFISFPITDWAYVGQLLNVETHKGSIVIGKCIKDSGNSLTVRNKYGTFVIQKNKIKKITRLNTAKTNIKNLKILKTTNNSRKTTSNKDKTKSSIPKNPEFYLGIYLNQPIILSDFSDYLSETPGIMLQLLRPLGEFILGAELAYLRYSRFNTTDRLHQFDFIFNVSWQIINSGSWRGFVFTGLGASLMSLKAGSLYLDSRAMRFQMQIGIGGTYIMHRRWQVQLRLPFTSVFESNANLVTFNLQLGVLFGF